VKEFFFLILVPKNSDQRIRSSWLTAYYIDFILLYSRSSYWTTFLNTKVVFIDPWRILMCQNEFLVWFFIELLHCPKECWIQYGESHGRVVESALHDHLATQFGNYPLKIPWSWEQ
jgi:hypothetical protein